MWLSRRGQFGVRLVEIPAQPLTGCMTLGELFNFFHKLHKTGTTKAPALQHPACRQCSICVSYRCDDGSSAWNTLLQAPQPLCHLTAITSQLRCRSLPCSPRLVYITHRLFPGGTSPSRKPFRSWVPRRPSHPYVIGEAWVCSGEEGMEWKREGGHSRRRLDSSEGEERRSCRFPE